MINFPVWIGIGAVTGWIASRIVKNTGRRGLIANIFAGIAGASLAGYFVNPIFGTNPIGEGFSVTMIMVPLGGAVVLLIILKAARDAKAFLNRNLNFSLY